MASDQGNATLVGSTLLGCSAATTGDAQAMGGAVYSFTGSLTLDRTNVSDCSVSASGSGDYALAHGGAVASKQSNATLVDSTLLGCSATAANAQGGAVFSYQGSLTLRTVAILDCIATAALGSGWGGGIYAETAVVLLSDQTVISGCHASSAGHSMYLDAGAFVTYALPASPGRYISGTTCAVYRQACPRDPKTNVLFDDQCPARAIACSQDATANASVDGKPCEPILSSGQPCDWRRFPQLLGRTVQALPQSPVEEEYPYACAAGLLGGADASDQGDSRCAGPCPAGRLCSSVATIEPVECPLKSYCPVGSSAATRCLAGTVGSRLGLRGEQECDPCPDGHWCRCVLPSWHPFNPSSR